MAEGIGAASGSSPRSTASSGSPSIGPGGSSSKGQAPFLDALLEAIGRGADRSDRGSTTRARD